MSVTVRFTDKEFYLFMSALKSQALAESTKECKLLKTLPKEFYRYRAYYPKYHPNYELSKAHAAQAKALDALIERLGGGA